MSETRSNSVGLRAERIERDHAVAGSFGVRQNLVRTDFQEIAQVRETMWARPERSELL
jgi:hypothetical protein